MSETIYHLPKTYDLEHASHEPDIGFYISLVQRWKPRRVLELGCGTGRVLIPLAAQAPVTTRHLLGLDCIPEMLAQVRHKATSLTGPAKDRIEWALGDMRTHRQKPGFDLIIAPCGTLSHLLSLEDQLATWRSTFSNLNSGGRFVADVPMAELPILAESAQQPRRATLQVDHDITRASGDDQKRLVRYKAVTYRASEQRASVHYLYDEYRNESSPDRFLSDYEHHVYFPRELALLFRATGFSVESIWGAYDESPLKGDSLTLVIVGHKP